MARMTELDAGRVDPVRDNGPDGVDEIDVGAT